MMNRGNNYFSLSRSQDLSLYPQTPSASYNHQKDWLANDKFS